MGTMAKRPDEGLIEFLTGALGEELRGVYRYDGDGIERLWPANGAGPTVADEAVLNRGIHVAARVGRELAGGSRPATSRNEGLLWLVDDRVVVLLPEEGRRGYVVTADRRTELPITRFVESCLAAMR